MRRWAWGLSSCAFAAALLHCSLAVDTDGLSGGQADATTPSLTDAPSASTEAGAETGVDGAASSQLGPLWLAYGSSAGAVGIRQWLADKGQWSSELPGPNVNGALVRWVVPKETPLGSFLAIVSSSPGGARLDVFERDATGAWQLGFTQPMAESSRRAFDIEYESRAHGVIVVYGDATHTPKMRRRTAAGWSTESATLTGATNMPRWIELARNPLTDEIALVLTDGELNLDASFWDGAAWGAWTELDAYLNTPEFKCFDAAYENGTGTLFVGWGRSRPADGGLIQDMRLATHRLGEGFGAATSIADTTPPGPMAMAAEPGSNRIAVSFMEYSCNSNDKPCDDFKGLIWDGAHISAAGQIDADTTTLYHSRPSSMPTGVAWVGTTGHVIAAYHRDLADPGQLAYGRFDGTAWGGRTGQSAPPPLPPRTSMQLVSAPNGNVVAVVEDTSGALWSKGYSEAPGAANGTWVDVAGGASLATTLLTSNGVPFGVTTP